MEALSAPVRLYLDRSPGEARGVVCIGGQPHRLLIERSGESAPRLGARYVARVTRVSPAMGLGLLDLGCETSGALRLADAESVHEGGLVEAEVVAEPVRDKPAQLRLILRDAAGQVGLSQPGPGLRRRLQAYAPQTEMLGGDEAQDAADAAQAEVLAQRFSLPNGLSVTIEPTHALVAVDLDLVQSAGPRSALRANLAALVHVARLLRLKALSGLVVVDLVGFPKERAQIQAAALEAFADDGPEIQIGAVSRFGALELAKPHREQPLHEQLLDREGRQSARTAAQDLLRTLRRQGRHEPGRRLVASCAPDVARELAPLVSELGPLFAVQEIAGASRTEGEVRSL